MGYAKVLFRAALKDLDVKQCGVCMKSHYERIARPFHIDGYPFAASTHRGWLLLHLVPSYHDQQQEHHCCIASPILSGFSVAVLGLPSLVSPDLFSLRLGTGGSDILVMSHVDAYILTLL